MMNRKSIEVFMQPENTHGGCRCSCNCSCSTQCITISQLAEQFHQKYGEIGEIIVHELTDIKKAKYVPRINKILSDSGEKLIVNNRNMSFVYSKLLPLIVVDGQIISVKNYPDEDQLYRAIVEGKRIPTQSSCC